MKELKRRGMRPTSLLEERGEVDFEEKQRSEEGDVKRKGVASAEYEKSLSNQRERSMALNSEGLEVFFYAPFFFTLVSIFHFLCLTSFLAAIALSLSLSLSLLQIKSWIIYHYLCSIGLYDWNP